MQSPDLYSQLRAEVESIPIVDTHEHLIDERERIGQTIDLFSLFAHYASSDLVSAGMPADTMVWLRDTAVPLDERWAAFAPFWRAGRTTAYGRALLLAAHDLFDVDDITDRTYQTLSERLSAANHSGWYHHVLKERANIHVSVLDVLDKLDPTPVEETDRRFFAPVLRVDMFLKLCDRPGLAEIERRAGRAVHSLDDLVAALDALFERAVAANVVAVKVAVAYERTIHFDKPTRHEAEYVFNQLTRYPALSPSPDFTPQPPVSFAAAKPLQDYIMHAVLQRAIAYRLPVQIHTGLQEGTGNFVSNAHPLQLVNVLIEYPEARFDLFHAGYPYQSEMATLGKNFPNAYLDLCWVHVISPWVARQTLHEWIETVPGNKIFAFGGDYLFVEGAYAHSRMARDNVAQVLSEKVGDGYLTETEAASMAHALLRDNALSFFRLPG
jgi:uncharacterized protein